MYLGGDKEVLVQEEERDWYVDSILSVKKTSIIIKTTSNVNIIDGLEYAICHLAAVAYVLIISTAVGIHQ